MKKTISILLIFITLLLISTPVFADMSAPEFPKTVEISEKLFYSMILIIAALVFAIIILLVKDVWKTEKNNTKKGETKVNNEEISTDSKE